MIKTLAATGKSLAALPAGYPGIHRGIVEASHGNDRRFKPYR